MLVTTTSALLAKGLGRLIFLTCKLHLSLKITGDTLCCLLKCGFWPGWSCFGNCLEVTLRFEEWDELHRAAL